MKNRDRFCSDSEGGESSSVAIAFARWFASGVSECPDPDVVEAVLSWESEPAENAVPEEQSAHM